MLHVTDLSQRYSESHTAKHLLSHENKSQFGQQVPTPAQYKTPSLNQLLGVKLIHNRYIFDTDISACHRADIC